MIKEDYPPRQIQNSVYPLQQMTVLVPKIKKGVTRNTKTWDI